MTSLSRLLLAISVLVPRSAQAQGTHPDLRYVPSPLGPAYSLAVDAKAGPLPFQLSTTPEAKYGSEDDPADATIGRIRDAVFTRSGQIAFLDDQYHHLWIFDRAGKLQSKLGREGGGPGEFADLLALTESSTGELLVADMSRSLKVFGSASGAYAYRRQYPLSTSARAICQLDSISVVNSPAPDGSHFLQTRDPNGTLIRAFGALYQSPNTMLNYQFSEGLLACESATNTAFFVSAGALGEIRAYTRTGEPLWRTRLTGLKANIIEDTQNGYSVARSPDGRHSPFSLVMIPKQGLLLQMAWLSPAGMKESAQSTTLSSFLIDPRTGAITALGDGLPPIVAATAERVLAAWDDPVPHFATYRIVAP